ncbi:hypothetical protein [Nonomuraea sp. NPDC049695]|uniref:hypothetical protein n=1 Tax=Nonomuraea sp. NPDC049695 TaxID=3154734 RepID=UPI00342EF887
MIIDVNEPLGVQGQRGRSLRELLREWAELHEKQYHLEELHSSKEIKIGAREVNDAAGELCAELAAHGVLDYEVADYVCEHGCAEEA